MEFEWDERKRASNLTKHAVDLLDGALIFDGHIITQVDERRDYGEDRFVSIGMAGQLCLVVVYTQRAGRIRLISAWKGGRHERALYQASFARGNQGDEGSGRDQG